MLHTNHPLASPTALAELRTQPCPAAEAGAYEGVGVQQLAHFGVQRLRLFLCLAATLSHLLQLLLQPSRLLCLRPSAH